jgi:hypothetical protein
VTVEGNNIGVIPVTIKPLLTVKTTLIQFLPARYIVRA